MSLADTAARGGAKMFGSQAIRVGINIVGVAVLSRLVSPGDFGLVAMVAAVANIAVVVGDFGLSAAAIQSQEITQAQRSNLFWTNVALGATLTAIVALMGIPLAAFYGHPEIAGITHAIAVSFLLSALATQFRAEMSRDLRFGALALVDTLAPMGALAAAIVAAIAGLGYWALVIQPVTLAFLGLVLVVPLSRWRPHRPQRTPMRDLYTFGASSLGIQVATYISTNIDDVLVGRFWGPTQAGYYSRAYQLFRLPMQQVAVPIARVSLPVLSRIQDDEEQFARFALRGQLLLAYVFGGIFYVLGAASDPVIDIALGPNWDEAKPIFLALAIGGVFQSITTGYWWIFQSKGLVVYLLKFSLAGRTAMIALLFLGLPWGAQGVAYASAAGQLLMWLVYTLFAVRRAGLSRSRLMLQASTPVACGLVAMGVGLAVSAAADGTPAIVQLTCVLITFAATVGLEWLVVAQLRSDLRFVARTARRALAGRR